MKPPLQHGSPDDFQTPEYALIPLLKYIKPCIVWECACGEGLLTEALKKHSFDTVSTDIKFGEKYNFLTFEPPWYDVIITNPPYKYKQQFLKRAYQLGKPFAFLLPLTTLETTARQELFKIYGLEIILLDKRVDFITPNKRPSQSWFATAWFTNGLNIGKSLTYETLDKPKKVF